MCVSDSLLRHRLPNLQHGGTVALQLSSRGPGDAADYEEAVRISGLIPPNCDLQRAPGASVSSLQIVICNHNTQLFELRKIRVEEKRAEGRATPSCRLIKGDSLISEISASRKRLNSLGNRQRSPCSAARTPASTSRPTSSKSPSPPPHAAGSRSRGWAQRHPANCAVK